MRIALRELRRRPGRFTVAAVILTLIAILVMFLGGLLDGLTGSSTGALRAQKGELIVFSSTSRDSIVRSRIEPSTARQVEGVEGVKRAGGLGSVQLGARLSDSGPRDLFPVVLFGYEIPPSDIGPPPPAGKVIADESLEADGVGVGSTLLIGPARSRVEVIGFATDSRYAGQGTLWGSLDTWRTVLAKNQPGARVGPDVVQALIVQTIGPVGGVATRIDRATGEVTSSLTIDQAIDALPGVSQQQAVFNQIIGITVLVAILVVALFFALITVERTPLYGVLKALGASSSSLFAGVLVQAFVVTLVACIIGGLAAFLLAALIPPGSIPFVASLGRVLGSAAFLLLAAFIGCAFSFRRVLKVDPATAIGGGQ
jgi:putative ABC transport system permease protein